MMFARFYPALTADSVYEIDFAAYALEGIRGVIFDIDNTLVPHNAPADGRARELFAALDGMGIRACLLSNNREPRVRSFAECTGADYIFKAGKPGISGYVRAMEKMGTDRKTTLFVGDQLFTDIYGANRAGIKSILVKPINPREEVQIVLKRFLEKPVLYCYRRKCRRQAQAER